MTDTAREEIPDQAAIQAKIRLGQYMDAVSATSDGGVAILSEYRGVDVEIFRMRVSERTIFSWPFGVSCQDIFLIGKNGHARRRILSEERCGEGPEIYALCQPDSFDFIPRGQGGFFIDFPGAEVTAVAIAPDAADEFYRMANMDLAAGQRLFCGKVADKGEFIGRILASLTAPPSDPPLAAGERSREAMLLSALVQMHHEAIRTRQGQSYAQIARLHTELDVVFNSYKGLIYPEKELDVDLAVMLKNHDTEVRELWGISPYQYLLERRLAISERLVGETDIPLVEIALECGFNSQAHFSSCFSDFFAMAPGRYRAKFRHSPLRRIFEIIPYDGASQRTGPPSGFVVASRQPVEVP